MASRSNNRRPTFTGDQLYESLRRYNREPFMDLLTFFMEGRITEDELKAFARKKPDLWIKSIIDLAKISGYTEKKEELHTIRIENLSDSQLQSRALELATRLGLPIPTLDITPNGLEEPISSTSSKLREISPSKTDTEPKKNSG